MPVTRPPPPSGRLPMYAMAGRAFGRTNLRPVMFVCTILAIIWSFAWSIGAFKDISGDKQNSDLKKLVTFDIVLGSLYAGVTVIELFGLYAAFVQRSSLARLFVFLSLFAALITMGAELTRTVVHFSSKSAILEECQLESNGSIGATSFGFWGGSTGNFSQHEIQKFCSDAYSHNSVVTIGWLILATLLSLFFASVAYSFYIQLLDPLTFRARAPSTQVRLEALNNQSQGGYAQDQYGYAPQPYGGGGYGGGNNPYPNFAPPPGPPPGAPPYEASKLPGYGADGGASREISDDKDKNPFQDGERDPFSDA